MSYTHQSTVHHRKLNNHVCWSRKLSPFVRILARNILTRCWQHRLLPRLTSRPVSVKSRLCIILKTAEYGRVNRPKTDCCLRLRFELNQYRIVSWSFFCKIVCGCGRSLRFTRLTSQFPVCRLLQIVLYHFFQSLKIKFYN